MSNVYSILTGKPVIQGARITSASKPDWTPNYAAMPAWLIADAKRNSKAMALQKLGWAVNIMQNGQPVFCNPHICEYWLSLDDAWKAQTLHEIGQRYWK